MYIYLFKAILSSSSTLPSGYREFLYHTYIENLSYGKYEIYNNGIGKGETYIFKLNNACISEVVYSPSYVTDTYPFSDKSILCKFINGKMTQTTQAIYEVGFVLNEKEEADIITIDSLQLILELINYDGGIEEHLLVPVLISWTTGDNNEMVEKVKEMLERPDLLCLVGTTEYIIYICRENQRRAISQLLVDKKKLLISPLIAGGEVTYENIIQINAISNQLFTIPLSYFLQKTPNLYIIYDGSSEY